MKITGSAGRVRVRLNLPEGHVLERLLDEMQQTMHSDALDPEVHNRLYPAAYEQLEDAASFRELTEDGLRKDRSERLDTCHGELLAARSLVRTDLLLDSDATDRWIRVLNDLRLDLGTRLDIAEDDDYDLDTNDPDVGERARYMWLTALQDMLVTTVMG